MKRTAGKTVPREGKLDARSVERFARQPERYLLELHDAEAGTAVLSPLLANLYLRPPDLLMEQSGCRMVRYAGDFVMLCASERKRWRPSVR